MVKKDLIEAENWAEITRLTREAVDTMLGFSLAHVGINCLDAQASERTARTICGLFGLPFRAGNSSNHAGTAVECTKAPGPRRPRTHRHRYQQCGAGHLSSGAPRGGD